MNLDDQLRLLGFTLVGNIKDIRILFEFKEVKKKMTLVRKEINNWILDDLIEAIQKDLESKHNKNPEKWVQELLINGWQDE